MSFSAEKWQTVVTLAQRKVDTILCFYNLFVFE